MATIRLGFVSNSSSSSYVILIDPSLQSDFERKLDMDSEAETELEAAGWEEVQKWIEDDPLLSSSWVEEIQKLLKLHKEGTMIPMIFNLSRWDKLFILLMTLLEKEGRLKILRTEND